MRLELAESAATPPDIIRHAEAHYRAGQYTDAAALLSRYAETASDPTVLRILGLCRLRQGSFDEALTLLARAFETAPEDPWTRLHYGVGLQAVGRHREAAALLQSCQALLPGDPAPPLNLAICLLALGDRSGALKYARKAVLRAPAMAEAHYAVGQARLACGQLSRAGEAFIAATRRAPNFADAWVNLGVVRYQLRDIHGARAAMQSALTADPNHVAAAANLGAFMRLTGEGEAAEAVLRDLLARHPEAAEARVNLAVSLLQEERAAEALALLDVPRPAEPRLNLHWRLQSVLALLQLGRFEEARAELLDIRDVSPSLAPQLWWRRLLLALAGRDIGEARHCAEQMAAALDVATDMVPEHYVIAQYDLAKFWSQQREPGRAFTYWQRGHAELRRFQPFSRRDYADFVDNTIDAFGQARFRDGPRASNSDATPVFVVGMPRSGTTLMEQILSAHHGVFGAGERSALAITFAQLGGAWESGSAARRVAAQDKTTLDVAAERYLSELHALAPGAQRIVDKMPGNFRLLGLAGLLLPGARIIHCARDPRDIGLSIFTFRFYGHHAYAHDLADLGWYIGQYYKLMEHWRAALPNPLLTVSLEDWVKDFSGTLHRVLEFLDLPYDPACERFYAQERRVRTVSRAQVSQPVNARGLGRWRGYRDHLSPLIAELEAGGVLPREC